MKLKRIIAMVLCFAMVLSTMSFSVFAEDATTPAGNDFTAYTNETSIWGEVWGNATESFVIKILDAEDNVMGTTSLNNIDGIIDGDVNVTWSIKLDAASNTDGYWTMKWATAPSLATAPAKVELWVDGVKVSGGNVVLNGPDDLYPVFAAKTDEDGNILSYIRRAHNADASAALASAITSGDNVAILAAGTYAVPTGKNCTITGAVDGVVFDNIGARNMGGADVTFNNVTFDYYPNVNYTGLQHSGDLVYNDCTFNGQVFLYGTSETFNNCTFNQESSDAYNVWTYSAKEVVFNECTVNSAGKSVLIYHEGASTFNDVTVTKTAFKASTAVEGKAAIEMDSSLTSGIKLTIDGETTATGFGSGNVSGNSLWNNKKGSETKENNDIVVVVDGEAILDPYAPVEVRTYEELVAALKDDNYCVKMMNDITADATQSSGYGKAGIVVEAGDILDGNGKKLTINGANATWDCAVAVKGGTVKNLTVAGGFRGIFMPGANGDVVIDGVAFEDVVYTFNSDAGSKDYTVTIKNSTLNGWTSFSNAHKSVTFENCAFGEGSGNAFMRPYQATTFTDCDFDEGFKFDASQAPAKSYEFFDCTYNGAPLSEDNGDMFYNGGTVIIDDEEVHYYSPDEIILINNIDDLVKFRDDVNAGNTYEGKLVKLTADIDFEGYTEMNVNHEGNNVSERTFRPIGDSSCNASFKGTFDGGNNTISNLYISGWDINYHWYNYGSAGLFGTVENATIKNLTMADVEIQVEGGDVAAIAGSATGTCIFENITITNTSLGTYNNGLGSIIGWSGAGDYTFKNINITDTVTLGGLWGSFDSSIGGVVGQAEPGARYYFENVDIACRLDVYNDVTASYDYYNYRMCGMIMGRLEKTTTVDGRAYPDPSKYDITLKDVDVTLGEWANYHYCRPQGGRGIRVEPGYQYGGIAADYDHSTCTVHHMELIPFTSLFGGAQYGVKGADKEDLKNLGFFDGEKNSESDLTVVDLAYVARQAAEIDGVYYETLQGAIDAADADDVITLVSNVTEEVEVVGKTVVIDLNGKTLNGAIKPSTGDITVKNGTIVNTNAGVSGIEIRSGKLTLENVNIDSARHAVRIDGVDGSVVAVINGGTYKTSAVGTKITQHAVNISGDADVTIKNGTFVGPAGTAADSGSAINVKTDSVVTINGGNFSGGKLNTLSASGTLTVYGGSFDQDPSAYVAENLNVTYDSFKKLYTVAKGWSISAEADYGEVKAGETVLITIKASGENFTAADWRLNYEADKFEFAEIVTDLDDADLHKADKSYISGVVMNTQSKDAYNNDTVLAVYKFTAKKLTEEVTGAFTLTNATVGTVAMASSSYPVAKPVNDEVKILLNDFTVSAEYKGEEVVDNKVQVPYDGNSHTIDITTEPAGAKIWYSTDEGQTWVEDVPEFTEYGEHKLTYKVDVPNGYDQTAKTQVTITVNITEPTKLVEVVDYVTGYKLVLVYTNVDNVYFTYGDRETLMLDVTAAGYKYTDAEGNVSTENYAHVYGYVVPREMVDAETAQGREFYEQNVKFAANTTATPVPVEPYDYNVNCDPSEATIANLADVVYTSGVFNAKDTSMEEDYMKAILKADVNRTETSLKTVNNDDITAVKNNYTENR